MTKAGLVAATMLATAAFAGPATAGETPATASVELKNLDGVTIGDADIVQTAHGIMVTVKVNDLPPGPKGIHLHAKADCTASTAFKSSLGHHGEGEGDHGLLNPNGPGKGDLGNIFVGENGVGEMQFFKAGVFLKGSDLPLMDDDGTAIVIHANMDDQLTQPIGGAGPRLVCGLVALN